MPRTARAIAAGYYYHALSRTNAGVQAFESPPALDAFLELMSDAQDRVPLDVLAVCLMPNHFHLVVRPGGPHDLSRWMHWLLTTHTHRHHQAHKSCGRIWQGRFKAFPIAEDRHLITVLRYVERNALRAGLVRRAEDWRWGSLAWRTFRHRGLRLADPPVPLPRHWAEYVNLPQTTKELAELRECVNSQRPYGRPSWARQAAHQLGLASSLQRAGRPRAR